MKKIFCLAAVLSLSGCFTDLTKYPLYDAPEPIEKAKIYLPLEEAKDVGPIRRELEKYFIPSSKQDADFILQTEEVKVGDPAFGSYLLSGLTLWILPTWGTSESSYSFSLTDMSIGRKIDLSTVRTEERVLYGWLLSPLLFSSDYSFAAGDSFYKAYASAIREAASLVYDADSVLYKGPEKRRALIAARRLRTGEGASPSVPDTAPAAAPAPVSEERVTNENLDLLW